ncbi:hypothetical protein V5O48_008057 [Marasmius crinis-equi]|uniref:Uncharacterized protein n=1 Tax=Marasmius crinis-equi TaxID=585013 RepID=A0ABR3FFH6_9AGAR
MYKESKRDRLKATISSPTPVDVVLPPLQTFKPILSTEDKTDAGIGDTERGRRSTIRRKLTKRFKTRSRPGREPSRAGDDGYLSSPEKAPSRSKSRARAFFKIANLSQSQLPSEVVQVPPPPLPRMTIKFQTPIAARYAKMLDGALDKGATIESYVGCPS